MTCSIHDKTKIAGQNVQREIKKCKTVGVSIKAEQNTADSVNLDGVYLVGGMLIVL